MSTLRRLARAAAAGALAAALGCAAPATPPRRAPISTPAPAPQRPAPRPAPARAPSRAAAPAPAPAPAPPAGPGPVTAENWRTHPSITAVRQLVAEGDHAVSARRWTRTQTQVCAPETSPRGYGLDRTVFMDERSRIRRYVVAEGDDTSTYKLEHHYDAAGRLRFVQAQAGAMDGASEKVMFFLDAEGGTLWSDRARSGPSHTFPQGWPEAAFVRDPSTDFVAPGPKGCAGR